MYLYNLTLQKPTAIHHAVHGNFSGSKSQEIIISRGRILELLKIDQNTGKLQTIVSTDVFGIIRSLMAFRLTGSTKDYIAVGSDSGRIVVLEYKSDKNIFDKIHQETYGKSGCRRIVPGQYMAIDPKGRAIMIAAVEKQKLVFILNRDQETRLTISSPLEAHKSNTFVYHIVGVDVGFENAMFACLEIDYEEADNDPTGQAVLKTQQTLTFYELDFGLNHVVRKYSEILEERANFLLSVPGGDDGPSGILICSENYITYKNLGDQPDIRCPIARRRSDLDDPERGMIFICSATHKTKSKTKTMFFFLIQTEQGDIFKITLECANEMVIEIRMKYFDTVPPAAAMCVLKTGFLFVACEFGNHYLYQIAHLGDNDDEPEFSSAMPLQEGDTFFFQPRNLLNLVLVDELESLSPIISCKVADLANEDTPQLYMMCGRSSRSTLRILRHGLEVTEMAISELPGSPNAVWTVKRRSDNVFDSYIILSFPNATLVLSIGETVEEVTDSGFLGTTPTLACSSLGKDVLIQVYLDGIRHIRADRRVNEWKTPHKKHIVKCAMNQSQVVIALSGGDLIYFEMDQSGKLNEHKESKRMPDEVLCMAIPLVLPGEQRSWFLAVGLADSSIRILSLDPSDCLSFRSTIAFPVAPDSLIIAKMGTSDHDNSTTMSSNSLYLYVGLHNGALQRTLLDPVTGDLTDTRIRYLGSKPVKLFRVFIHGNEAVLAVSSRTWLSYYFQNRFFLTPLSYQNLEYASGFSSEQCPEGIVSISANTLRILALEKLGAVFNQISYPLEYTPRKFLIHPNTQILMIAETDHNAFTEHMKRERRVQLCEEMKLTAEQETENKEFALEMAESFLNDDLPEAIFSAPKAGYGLWASKVQCMDPLSGKNTNFIPFFQNEAVLSLVMLKFIEYSDHHWYFVIGTAKDLQLNPRQFSSGALITYKVDHLCRRFEFLHRTPVNEVPNALCSYHGRLLAGIGKRLVMYQYGKKKLLKKCENKHLPNLVIDIQVMGNRIFVCDVQESVYVLRYKKRENQMVIFADDTNPRCITCATILDYDTVAVADKFGNICIMRLPMNTNDDFDDDPTGAKSLWDRGLLSGASQKFHVIASIFIGETVTSLQKATLIPGGRDSLVYVTLSGTVGTLGPFNSAEDHDFFQNLELHIRNEQISLVGRDHLSFRSSYFPVKNVIDGDLCEQYSVLEYSKQRSIANDLERTPAEVNKKLEDIRTKYAF